MSGWPIAQRDVAAYYPRAGVLCQLGRMDYDGVESWQRQAGFVPLALPGATIVPAVGQFSPPTRFGTAYRQQLKLAANVTVVLNSNVQDLVSGPDGTRIETAGVKCFGGAAFVVAARRFVLAMGGLETTRLLLLSRRHQPRMLGDGHDMLGRCYMDHPGLSGGQVQFSPSAPDMGFFTDYHEVGDSRLYGIFTPRPEVVARENIGNFRIQLFPVDLVPGIESFHALATTHPDPGELSQIGYHLGNVLVDIDRVADLVYKNALHRKLGFLGTPVPEVVRGRGALIHVSAEQVPNPDSRVVLSDQFDPFGQPRIKLMWQISDADRRTLTRSLELFAAGISAAGLGRVRLEREVGTPGMDCLVEIACHHMGTTRMSVDPKDGVVDPDCKVHGVRNLYIASSSVFPTTGWSNPTLTIIALALRLADHIKMQDG